MAVVRTKFHLFIVVLNIWFAGFYLVKYESSDKLHVFPFQEKCFKRVSNTKEILSPLTQNRFTQILHYFMVLQQ